MIHGHVSEDRVPYISVDLAGSRHPAIVDSGFNGDMELPKGSQADLSVIHEGEVTSTLAAGISIREELFRLEFVFDGEIQTVYVCFSDTQEALLGTRLLRRHRLEIDFPAQSLRLVRVA